MIVPRIQMLIGGLIKSKIQYYVTHTVSEPWIELTYLLCQMPEVAADDFTLWSS